MDAKTTDELPRTREYLDEKKRKYVFERFIPPPLKEEGRARVRETPILAVMEPGESYLFVGLEGSKTSQPVKQLRDWLQWKRDEALAKGDKAAAEAAQLELDKRQYKGESRTIADELMAQDKDYSEADTKALAGFRIWRLKDRSPEEIEEYKQKLAARLQKRRDNAATPAT